MHERGAVGKALDVFLQETAGRPIGRVRGLFGAGVDPHIVRDVWHHMTLGTHAEGADLDLAPAIGVMRCFSCGEAYPGGKLHSCPFCRGSGLPVSDPPELAIVDWEPA